MEIVDVLRLLLVAVIDARLFDAVVAPGTVFPPIDYPVFADARPPRRNRVSFNVIFVRHSSSRQLQSGGGTQLRHDRLPAARKYMYPAQTIQSLELFDRFNADGQAFLPAIVARLFQSFNDIIRDAEFGVGVPELLRFRRAVQGKDAGQNCRLFGNALLADSVEPATETLSIKYCVCLNKSGAGFDFLVDSEKVQLQRF